MSTLTHGVDEIVRQLLIDLGLGVAGSWSGNVYSGQPWAVTYGEEADKPDQAITVYETTGSDHGRAMVTGERLGEFGVQIKVRGSTKREARSKADQIWTHLARYSLTEGVYDRWVTVESTAYVVHCFSRIGDIMPLGKAHDGRRYQFTINALVGIEQQ